jgi:protein-S-isoprenylcysteine O-methyltransferase Ste14
MSNLTRQFILLCWGIFVAYFAATAFAVKRTVEKQDWKWRLILGAVVVAAVILIRRGGALSAYTGAVLWPSTVVIGVIADVVTLGGLAVVLWARYVLGENWSGSPAIKENHELIERGPYAYVRHPIYSGLLVMILGAAILYGRVSGFALLVAAFIGIGFKAFQEERLLTRHFPTAYPEYRARVKALIPFMF